MGAHKDAMMRIVAAVVRAKQLGAREQRELQAEFEEDAAEFLQKHANELTSVSEADLALFREPL